MSAPAPQQRRSELVDPNAVGRFLSAVFETTDDCVISLLGVGEKGTPEEGVYRKRVFTTQDQGSVILEHILRWADLGVAAFFVPAALTPGAETAGNVKEDKIAAFTSIMLDLDTGDIEAKARYVSDRLGPPSIVVLSGGKTETGQAKRHLYYNLDEATDEVARVGRLRKLLAAKVGGDQSFGRVTQVARVAGSVHCKNGVDSPVRLLECNDRQYGLEDLAEIIEAMQPMAGIEPVQNLHTLPAVAGMMDFAPRTDTALAALHRDVHEGGEELNRWGEFNKAAGFLINEARAGRITAAEAAEQAHGWVLLHMIPAWPVARFQQEFAGLWRKDIATHGPMPAAPVPWSNVAIGAALPLEYFGDIQASLTNAWLVRDLLMACGLAAMYGYPGSGKSFLAVDFALRIAAGLRVDGRAVRQCPVVYIAAEGQRGLRNRVVAFRSHHSIEGDLPFALIPCAVNLLDPKADLARLIEAIEQAAARLGGQPGLIVVDTLAATFGGGDENTSAMIGYINNLAILRDTFGATVLLVHHRPKDATNNTPRGHGSLMGAMDTIILVESSSVARFATITKQKDADAGAPLTFVLKSVWLGEDEEGGPVTAAVVEYRQPPAGKKLSPGPAAILQALSDAIDEVGGAPVLEVVWRAKWSTDPAVSSKTDDTQRKAWERGRDALRAAGRVHAHEGEWSIPATPAAGHSLDFTPRAAS